jgi:predicted Zn-dependent protease
LRDLTHAEWFQQRRQLEALGGDWQPLPPESRAWHRRQAAAAEDAKQWYAAAFHLRRLLANDPGNVEYLERLGAALYGDGRHAEAVAKLTEAVAKHGQGGTVGTQLYLALVHQCLGHAADARTWLARAIRQLRATNKPRPEDERRWSVLRKEAEKLLKPRP